MGKHAKEVLRAPEFCPVRHTMKILGKRWTILIIKEIYFSGKKELGFMAIKKGLGDISTKVLSERLKEMVREDLLKRRVIATKTPVRVNYSLTEKGHDVCDIVNDLREYGLKWGDGKVNDCRDTDCEICTKERQDNIN